MGEYSSVSDTLGHKLESQLLSTCCTCGEIDRRQEIMVSSPPLLAFDLSYCPMSINHHLVVTVGTGGVQAIYTLRAVMYYSPGHFTSRFITQEGVVWYHDGSLAIDEGPLQNMANLSHRNTSETATATLYARAN